MSDETEKIDVTDMVEELPLGRVLIAFERAVREFGHEPDEDERYEDEFIDIFSLELRKLVAEDITGGLVEQGLVDVAISDGGELTFVLNEKGLQELE